jgi:hypothetical protein
MQGREQDEQSPTPDLVALRVPEPRCGLRKVLVNRLAQRQDARFFDCPLASLGGLTGVISFADRAMS